MECMYCHTARDHRLSSESLPKILPHIRMHARTHTNTHTQTHTHTCTDIHTCTHSNETGIATKLGLLHFEIDRGRFLAEI